MNTHSLELVACKEVLGLLRPEHLPVVAAQALHEGHDSPLLRKLAGLSDGASEARALFHRCLAELNVKTPTKRDAVVLLAREIALSIIRGDVDPYKGAQEVWQLTLLADEGVPELDSFVYAASEWNERPADHDVFEEGVVAAAGELVRQGPSKG
jgi:hypothetical protein